MENGNIRDYVRKNPGADRLRLLGEVASGAHKDIVWRQLRRLISSRFGIPS